MQKADFADEPILKAGGRENAKSGSAEEKKDDMYDGAGDRS
jgi:hypothetical protein